MEDFSIIEYSKHHTQELKELLYKHYLYQNTISDYPSTQKMKNIDFLLAEMIEDVYSNEGKIFLVKSENVLLGFVSCKIKKTDELAKFENGKKNVGLIGKLFIIQEFRGKGIGKMLLKKAENYLKNNSCSYMRVNALSNNKRAIKFYNHNGYHDRFIGLLKQL